MQGEVASRIDKCLKKLRADKNKWSKNRNIIKLQIILDRFKAFHIAINPISSKIPRFLSCFDVDSFVIDLRGNTEKVLNAKVQTEEIRLNTITWIKNPMKRIINPTIIKLWILFSM